MMPNPIGQLGIGNIVQTGAVEQAAHVSRVDLVAGHIVGELSTKVDAYFKEREASGQPPWPQGGKATLVVIQPESYASGNFPELEDAMKTLSVGERQELVAKVQQHLAAHGYSSHIDDDINAMRLNVTLWDPHWNPFPVYVSDWYMSTGGYRKAQYQYQPDPEGWIHQTFWEPGKVNTVHHNVVSGELEVRPGHVTDRSAGQISGGERNRLIQRALTSVFKPGRLRPT
jgi:hypothetical protein